MIVVSRNVVGVKVRDVLEETVGRTGRLFRRGFRREREESMMTPRFLQGATRLAA